MTSEDIAVIQALSLLRKYCVKGMESVDQLSKNLLKEYEHPKNMKKDINMRSRGRITQNNASAIGSAMADKHFWIMFIFQNNYYFVFVVRKCTFLQNSDFCKTWTKTTKTKDSAINKHAFL